MSAELINSFEMDNIILFKPFSCLKAYELCFKQRVSTSYSDNFPIPPNQPTL
jgi:hypothetical protein